jgi:hypothetical protein
MSHETREFKYIHAEWKWLQLPQEMPDRDKLHKHPNKHDHDNNRHLFDRSSVTWIGQLLDIMKDDNHDHNHHHNFSDNDGNPLTLSMMPDGIHATDLANTLRTHE